MLVLVPCMGDGRDASNSNSNLMRLNLQSPICYNILAPVYSDSETSIKIQFYFIVENFIKKQETALLTYVSRNGRSSI
jgi:hypothetical protein